MKVGSRQLEIAWVTPFDGNSPLTHYVVQHWPAPKNNPTPDDSTRNRGGSVLNTSIASDTTHSTIQVN